MDSEKNSLGSNYINKTIITSYTPISFDLINETHPSTMIVSTIPKQNYTLLSLANGMTLDTNSSLYSGESILLDIQNIKPICINTLLLNNITFTNATNVSLIQKIDPLCQKDVIIQNILGFHLINQK